MLVVKSFYYCDPFITATSSSDKGVVHMHLISSYVQTKHKVKHIKIKTKTKTQFLWFDLLWLGRQIIGWRGLLLRPQVWPKLPFTKGFKGNCLWVLDGGFITATPFEGRLQVCPPLCPKFGLRRDSKGNWVSDSWKGGLLNDPFTNATWRLHGTVEGLDGCKILIQSVGMICRYFWEIS